MVGRVFNLAFSKPFCDFFVSLIWDEGMFCEEVVRVSISPQGVFAVTAIVDRKIPLEQPPDRLDKTSCERTFLQLPYFIPTCTDSQNGMLAQDIKRLSLLKGWMENGQGRSPCNLLGRKRIETWDHHVFCPSDQPQPPPGPNSNVFP